MKTRRLDLLFAFLIAATAATWQVGEAGAAGPGAVALVLGLAGLKGWGIIREFMLLRRASPAWNLILGGWLALVLAIIAATYWKALP